MGKPWIKRPLGRPRKNRIILKWLFKKQDEKLWTRFIWLGIGTSGGFLSTWWNIQVPLTLTGWGAISLRGRGQVGVIESGIGPQ